ncbi:MAG: class F sortase [Chloroflexota bacterium]
MKRAGRSAGSTVVLAMVAVGAMLMIAAPTIGQVMPLSPTQTPIWLSPTETQATLPATIPGPLVDPALRLLAGPVDVPLEIQIPALKIKAAVLGVGLTETNAMASPIGVIPDDPIWQTVFWYRGGGIPGDVGTATFAGHFDDALGRPAVFAYLGNLQIGDVILVEDTRSGLDIPFIVTETKTYTDQESAEPNVLARIFGFGLVTGMESQPVADQLSHLTLITCGGAWINGSFDLRLVVYATRASYPLRLGE